MKLVITLCLFWILSISPAMALVDLNTASKAELESLTGIGPAKAQAILDYRKKVGSFKSVDELEQVGGIGPAIMNTIKKEVTIGGKSKPNTADLPKTSAPATKK